jgi:hypothetical protein
LYRSSGLPSGSFHDGLRVAPANLLIAFPVGWGLLAWGLGDYWKRAGLDECFLLGWVLGCLALTFSEPFYPFPNRGTLTLQVPLYVAAGAIYFSRHARVTWRAAVVAVVAMGATPVLQLARLWDGTRFDAQANHMFVTEAHEQIIHVLQERATEGDVLLADFPATQWLTPEYPGQLYCCHPYLTVDLDRKRAERAVFFESEPEAQFRFLRENRIRFVFVDHNKSPLQADRIPGLQAIRASPAGELFAYFPKP